VSYFTPKIIIILMETIKDLYNAHTPAPIGPRVGCTRYRWESGTPVSDAGPMLRC
jgi:hypothetical protein